MAAPKHCPASASMLAKLETHRSRTRAAFRGKYESSQKKVVDELPSALEMCFYTTLIRCSVKRALTIAYT